MMKDSKKLIVASILFVLVVVAMVMKSWMVHPNADAKKFQEEYESLNGTVRESDGATYQSITIPLDNPIVYVDTKKALEVLKDEQAILYVGANWCPWCRNAVPVLLEVAKEKKIDKVYYLNLDEEKSSYQIQDGKLVQTKEGTSGYYELLSYLDKELQDYVLTDSDGKKYDTKEKRIYMPFVVASNRGTVTKTHVGTVSLDDNQTKYSALTEEQKKNLRQIYVDLMDSLTHSSCENNNCD